MIAAFFPDRSQNRYLPAKKKRHSFQFHVLQEDVLQTGHAIPRSGSDSCNSVSRSKPTFIKKLWEQRPGKPVHVQKKESLPRMLFDA